MKRFVHTHYGTEQILNQWPQFELANAFNFKKVFEPVAFINEVTSTWQNRGVTKLYKYFPNSLAFFHSFKYQVIMFFNVFVNMGCFNAREAVCHK